MKKTKVRESNIELLRNISMFMILIIHANFVALPHIQYNELMSDSVSSITRLFFESFGIVAVNVFVLISGWFGIRTRTKGVLSFIYQILFFLGGGGILFILLGTTTFSLRSVLEVFQFAGKDWFIKAYIILMILSPALNTFSQKAEEKTQRYVVIAYMLFEAIWCWAANGARFFLAGYGPLHFIGLYMTAQYIHNQIGQPSTPNWIRAIFSFPKWIDLGLFCLTIVMNTAFVVGGSFVLKGVETPFALIYAYSNPLVILGALYLQLFFSKLKMPYVKLINWMGASSFAVYLIHTQTTFFDTCFTPQVCYIYDKFSGGSCIGMFFIFLSCIYIIAILIDQLRLLTWDKLWDLKKLK